MIMPSVDFWLEYGFSFSEDYLLILSLIFGIVPFLVLIFKVSGSIDVYNTTKSTVLDAITESLRKNGIEYYEMMLEPKILLTQYEGCSIKIKHSSDSAFIKFRKFNKVPVSKKDIKREFKDAINNFQWVSSGIYSVYLHWNLVFFAFAKNKWAFLNLLSCKIKQPYSSLESRAFQLFFISCPDVSLEFSF